MPPPAQPKIYHIAHVDRLPSILADGELWCDRRILARAGAGTVIGMGSIKHRRLTLPVHPHPGTHVGDYVPFYFCPRSVMLFVIYRANHPELDYRGGQHPSCIWRPTSTGSSRGSKPRDGAGRSRCQMPGLRTRNSGRASTSWSRSTGMRWRQRISERQTLRRVSRPSSWCTTPSPGIWSSGSASISRPIGQQARTRCGERRTGPRSKSAGLVLLSGERE